MDRAFETWSDSVEEDVLVSTARGEELDLLKKMDQLLKELKQRIIDKGNEKRPKTLIEAKAHMSEWCDARGKQRTDDLVMECLALAYLKNPHLNDEIYEWILWTWEMKESLEKETSKDLVGEYEKIEKEMAASFGAELNLAVKENYEKGTINDDDEPGLVADLLQGLNLRMDDNNKMFEPGSTVNKVKNLVDIYADTDVSLNLEEGRPKRTTKGQALKPQVTCEIMLGNKVICLMFCFSIAISVAS